MKQNISVRLRKFLKILIKILMNLLLDFINVSYTILILYYWIEGNVNTFWVYRTPHARMVWSLD